MAGTSRFHDKLHRANHHSVVSPGLPDSAYDPIASMDHPFRGDFILSGALSALNDASVNSLTTRKNLTVNQIAQFDGPIYTNNTGSVITTNSYPVTANNGPATLTFNYNKGVYINGTFGSTPKLVVGIPGYDAGTVSVTNVDATSARLTTLTVSSAVGIGTTTPEHALHVIGDVIIYGTLTANGNSYFQNTLFSTTSSLSIVNTGSGAGLTVTQQGDQPIAAFYDHDTPGTPNIALWVDGANARPGWVGVKTVTPNVEFTVAGSISSSDTIYSASSNSNQWVASYTSTAVNSAKWDSNYTTTNTNSARWAANYTTTNTKSASWDSNYTTVLSNSASWGSGGTSSSVVASNSAKWESNYTTTNTNSARWAASYTTTNTKSASWDSSYSTVLASSASWGSGGTASSVVASNSAKWDSNYTTVSAKSASWDSSYATVLANSASWNAGGGSGGASYVTVNAFSASWNNSYNTLTATSASWSSVYTTTSTNSARWDSTYNTTNTNSGNWDSSYVTLLANSGVWDSAAGALGDIDLDYLADVSITSNTLADGQVLVYDIGTQQWENSSLVLSGVVQGSSTWASSYSTTNSNSANWSTAYTQITANSATWNTNSLSGSTDVTITSPANNALLQYDTSTGKWVDGDTLITTGTLTAGSIDLTTAEVSTFETDLSASGDFLLIRINGVVRKLRLWD